MLRRITLALFAGCLLSGITTLTAMAQTSTAFVNTLMPEPAHLTVEQGILPITTSFTAATDSFHDARLDNAIGRMLVQLEQQTGVQMALRPTVGKAATLLVTVAGPGEDPQTVTENESYTLDVTPTEAHITAATDVGAMHGLETLLQLVQPYKSGYFFHAVSIQDAPRFPWRGLMIDCSRHFEPVSEIERTLDAMAAVKLNVFHWHLSDDQGFRMESKVFPKLTGMGSEGKFYTQAQAREIVAYARARGIRVVPEFDMPAHTTSWFVGYPNLASAPGPFQVEHQFGVFDPVMDPTRKSTYEFIDKFIGEMVTIFPDPYFHIGGDENNGVEWKNNPRIQAFMKAHHLHGTAALQTYFNQNLLPILKKHDRKMVGWDEILAPGLPKNAVVQSWRGFASLDKAAEAGNDAILSSGWYLDHIENAAQYYEVDPLPKDNTLTPAEQARILGGEACMWGEHVNSQNIDTRMWPMTAAIAERLWSPQSVNNVNDMYRRLWVENLRLEALGTTQISHEGVALRQLAETTAIGPLRVVAGIMRPIGFDMRYQMQHTSQVTPLDNLVDALHPDPLARHEVKMLVHNYLAGANPQAADQLNAIFASWVAAGPGAESLMQNAPRLRHVTVRAQQMVELGNIGEQALGYLTKHEAAPSGWASNALAQIDQAKKPNGTMVSFVVLEPLRDLVQAVQ